MARILLMDDDLTFCDALATALSSHGHDVTVTHTAPEAQMEFEAGDFDLAIVDMFMTDPLRFSGRSGGLALISTLRAANRKVPILAISAGFGSERTLRLRRTALEMGADRILGKPFALTALLDEVAALTA